MPVTRNVILDLLPLYLADEVSPDTRALVSEYLSRDPALADEVRRLQQAESKHEVPVPPDLEVQALARLRKQIALRYWALGAACFFTPIALGMQMDITSNGIHNFHFLLAQSPAVFVPVLIVAALCWAAYFSLRRR